MFEAALVESSGKLQSKSGYWMIATFALNLAALAVMVLVPLLHPEALPKTALIATLTAPPPPPPAAPPTQVQVKAVRAVAPLNAMTAPSQIPHRVDMTRESPPPPAFGLTGVVDAGMSSGTGPEPGLFTGMGLNAPTIVARPPEKARPTGPVRISSGVAAGAILVETTPAYPAIARAAHVSGSVVLHAIITRAGTIESLQVISGPEMLRASALEAVRQWRYKPFLLNGEPTAVDTAVTVNFSFGS